MATYSFETSSPVKLYIELRNGDAEIDATETTTSSIRIDGRDADKVEVVQVDDEIRIIQPKQHGFSFFESSIEVAVTVPTGSQLMMRTGSGDLATHGELKAVQVKTGSGDVSLDRITELVSIRSGSGDVVVNSAKGRIEVTSGSGDIVVHDSDGDIDIKTGSGDVSIDRALRGRLSTTSGSGDLSVGVVAGVPVWTDIVVSPAGGVHSSLKGAGRPAPGQDHLEIRARSGSGDVTLIEV